MVEPFSHQPAPHSFEGPRFNSDRDPERDGPFMLHNRYWVVNKLGEGGMGTVYAAKDTNFAAEQTPGTPESHERRGAPRVVKKLRDDFFREEDKEKAVAFFLREAEILSQLKDPPPNIVRIWDRFVEVDETGGRDYYLVMDYVEGDNLHKMLYERQEPFSEEDVLNWSLQICRVLDYLHTHEPPVIYRDLKPSNIMFEFRTRRVKLVDFGIARPYQEDSDNTHVVSQGYSPPEQYWGAADPRSDIYALGATMYFLLTGQEPLALQVSSPKQINNDISDRLDLVVQRATQQDPLLRYQSAAEMLEELEEKPQTESPRPSLRLVDITLAIFLMVSSLGAFMLFVKLTDGDKGANQANKQTSTKDRIESERRENLLKDALQRERETNEKLKQVFNDKVEESAKSVGTQELTFDTPEKKKATLPESAALQDVEEKELTDPEGLAPFEPDSNNKQGFSFPNLNFGK